MNKQSKSQWLSGFFEMTHGRPMCFLGVWPLTGNKAGSQKGDQTITKLMVSIPQGWCRIRDFTEMVLIQSVCWCIDDSIYIYIYIYIFTYLGGGFKYFLMFIPIWGNDPIWRAYFWKGLKPPTRHLYIYMYIYIHIHIYLHKYIYIHTVYTL